MRDRDRSSEDLQKRLSCLSIDSAYESIDRIQKRSPGEITFLFLFNNTFTHSSLEFIKKLKKLFLPKTRLDLDGLISVLNQQITPQTLDKVVFSGLKDKKYVTLDQELVTAITSFLLQFSLEGVQGCTRAGIRQLVTNGSRAFEYFQEAVENITDRLSNPSAQALAWLGKCHLQGIGTSKNTALAFDCFIEAGRYKSSSDTIPLLLEFVKYAENDHERILWWLRQLSKSSTQAQFLLSQCYFQGLFGIPADMDMARVWLAKAQGNGLFGNKNSEKGFDWEIFAAQVQ